MHDIGSGGSWELTKLYRAWERHYEALGLGTNRARGLALKKGQEHKAPPGYTFEQLARFLPNGYKA
jgi:hypothetical protein